MKHWNDDQISKCRTDFNFEVDFKVNGVIGTIAIKWDLIQYNTIQYNTIQYNTILYPENRSFLSII